MVLEDDEMGRMNVLVGGPVHTIRDYGHLMASVCQVQRADQRGYLFSYTLAVLEMAELAGFYPTFPP